MRPRLLLITYSFVPDALVGALRWQKLARHASDFGWGLDVITLSSRQFDRTDETALLDLPPDIRRIEVPQRQSVIGRVIRSGLAVRRAIPKSEGSAINAVSGPQVPTVSTAFRRSLLAVLEYGHHRRWAHDAFRVARRLIDRSVHQAIVTTGPPHMAHEAGRLASRESGLPLVVDFRDPWSGVERLDDVGLVWYRLARMYERRVMSSARIIVANTDLAAGKIRAAYPEHADRVITVMNGYDDDTPVPEVSRGRRFLLAFAGSIYLDRSPRSLFEAAARVIRELQLTPLDFSIEFMGQVSHLGDMPLREIAREFGIADFVVVHPRRDRGAAHQFLASAAMLLNLPQENRSAIPAKLYEYMRFPAWILALADANSATGILLKATEADLVAPDNVDGIAHVLRERILQFRAGVLPHPIARNGRFSRRHQAVVLFDAIKTITDLAATNETGAVSGEPRGADSAAHVG